MKFLENSKLSLCTILLFCQSMLYSIPACKEEFKHMQPNNTILHYYIQGDEHFKYHTTTDGYIIKKDSSGNFRYANFDDLGILRTTSIYANDKANRLNSELQYLECINQDEIYHQIKIKKQKSINKIQRTPIQKSFPAEGNPKSIVILVNFKDLAFVTPNPKQEFLDLLNKQGYSKNLATGSVSDYFNDNSMGKFKPQFDVFGPFNLNNDMKYYGENDQDNNDKNPRQMVLEACSLASRSGVDLSVYDTDKDGYLDNVFIYYAGHNEAEGDNPNTIWPHRWSVKSDSTFNNVKVAGYACTSELRSSSGSNLCGIGTFIHEFGHVLGLPDYYPTDGGSHHTLSVWNVMDGGSYLNLGRTPPAYSAWDRLYLGWIMDPDICKENNLYKLDTLSTSNKALFYFKSDTNFDELFTFENRQKVGWDKYLPNHGMLVTHIFFDVDHWIDNSPNNDKNLMDVDILEADKIASYSTLAGDTYPGSNNVNSLTLDFRDVETKDNWINNISEKQGIISFELLKTDSTSKELTIKSNGNGSYSVYLPHNKGLLEVYDMNGALVLTENNPIYNPYTIVNLAANRFYIIKFEDYKSKIFTTK